jgi:hypothetical protein
VPCTNYDNKLSFKQYYNNGSICCVMTNMTVCLATARQARSHVTIIQQRFPVIANSNRSGSAFARQRFASFRYNRYKRQNHDFFGVVASIEFPGSYKREFIREFNSVIDSFVREFRRQISS